jgi:hypothetical protein
VLLAAPHHVNNATECSAQRPSHRAPCSLGPSVTDGSLYLGRERTEHCWDTKTSPSEGRREHRSVLEPRRSASTGRAAPRAQASRLRRVVRGTCPRRSPTAPQVLARLGAAPSDMRSYHCILVAPSCNQLTCMTSVVAPTVLLSGPRSCQPHHHTRARKRRCRPSRIVARNSLRADSRYLAH